MDRTRFVAELASRAEGQILQNRRQQLRGPAIDAR